MSSSSILQFPEPPTSISLSDARRSLEQSLTSLTSLSTKITDAEQALQKMIREAQSAMDDMRHQKAALQSQVLLTRSYLAPVRRLPDDLLREVFCWSFENHPCVAWVLSSVCKVWRRIALNMPSMWSKIRLHTTHNSSPDAIRLWLQRSGTSVPLDIEIFLESNSNHHQHPGDVANSPKRYSISSRSTTPQPISVTSAAAASSQPPHPAPPPYFNHMQTPISVPIVVVPSPAGGSSSVSSSPTFVTLDAWGSPIPMSYGGGAGGAYIPGIGVLDKLPAANRSVTHWAHVALFYLVEEMHRWERFVFRFDKHFPSMEALKSVVGDAPLLRDFEISCAEATPYPEWQWLPCATPSRHPSPSYSLPKLQSLTLQYSSFKWTSPMFHNTTGLQSLNICALPSFTIPLDRILDILKPNKDTLRHLSLHIQSLTRPVLPLTNVQLTFPHLKDLSLGGNHFMTQLLDLVLLPVLKEFNLDIESGPSHNSLDEVIISFLKKPGMSPTTLKHLSIGFGFGCGHRSSKSRANQFTPPKSPFTSSSRRGSLVGRRFTIGSGSYFNNWSSLGWSRVLRELNELESLRAGGTSLESIISSLSSPEETLLNGPPSGPLGGGPMLTSAHWICPNLKELGMKNCLTHPDDAPKLVEMVEARNPSGGSAGLAINGVTPKKLTWFEMDNCLPLGYEVVQWLESKVDEFGYSPPVCDDD